MFSSCNPHTTGDEVSDDKMFVAVADMLRCSGPGHRPKDMRNYSVVVGRRDSPADSYVNDVKDVEELLLLLAYDDSTFIPYNEDNNPEMLESILSVEPDFAE